VLSSTGVSFAAGVLVRFSSSLSRTDNDLLQFIKYHYAGYNAGRLPEDNDMLDWEPAIHATNAFNKENGKPGGFVHYISDGELIAPAKGSSISDEHVAMLQLAQELTKRGDHDASAVLQSEAAAAMELDPAIGNLWVYLWNGEMEAGPVIRAAKVRGVKKELKFQVRVEMVEGGKEKITATIDTEWMSREEK